MSWKSVDKIPPFPWAFATIWGFFVAIVWLAVVFFSGVIERKKGDMVLISIVGAIGAFAAGMAIFQFFRLTAGEKHAIKYGNRNSKHICPHCKIAGMVRIKQVSRASGLSGTKVTTGILTGGLSLPATGLAGSELSAQAHCDNCETTWIL